MMFEIEKIAALARLYIDDSEKDALAAQLSDMMRFAQKLSDAVWEDVLEPTEEALTLEDLRADEPQSTLPREELLALAPQRSDGYFYVPKVVKQEEEA